MQTKFPSADTNTGRGELIQSILRQTMDHTLSTTACAVCKQCGRILTKDEIGLHKKLYNRGATSYFCIDCSSQYLEVPVPLLQKKIEEFKAMGCTLFV